MQARRSTGSRMRRCCDASVHPLLFSSDIRNTGYCWRLVGQARPRVRPTLRAEKFKDAIVVGLGPKLPLVRSCRGPSRPCTPKRSRESLVCRKCGHRVDLFRCNGAGSPGCALWVTGLDCWRHRKPGKLHGSSAHSKCSKEISRAHSALTKIVNPLYTYSPKACLTIASAPQHLEAAHLEGFV